jgi:hypothetical protein
MHVVFDLDGTLVDTEYAVIDAYAAVGITYPAEAWGKPWQAWLPKLVGDEEVACQIHDLKNVAYLALIDAGKVEELPAATLARTLVKIPEFMVTTLTGASLDATAALCDTLGLERVGMLTGYTLGSKVAWLNGDHGELPGIYFDDNAEALSVIRVRTKWATVHVHRGQSLHDLLVDFSAACLGGLRSTP